MNYLVTREAIEQANALVGNTPKVLGRRIIARIEVERGLPRGCISNGAIKGSIFNAGKRHSYTISAARRDAIAEIYETFLHQGKRLTTHQMASIFNLSHTVMHRVIIATRGNR